MPEAHVRAIVLLGALAIDALVGDPPWLYARVPHPVAWLGRGIDWIEPRVNRPSLSRARRFGAGAILAATIVLLAVGAGLALTWALSLIPWGRPLEAVVVSTLLATRSLHDHVAHVASELEAGLERGRAAVGHIVGRDPASLDAAGVARAAVESAAENLSDGVVAPAFFFAFFGLPGIIAYKAANTLDSMLGHRSDRLESFGKASARLDDVASWLPARLTGLLLVAAAGLSPRASARTAGRTMRRDARKHVSPNAGWPEAAMAGALGLRLGGPRCYPGHTVAGAWLGDGRDEAQPGDIRRALRVNALAVALLAGALVLLAIW